MAKNLNIVVRNLCMPFFTDAGLEKKRKVMRRMTFKAILAETVKINQQLQWFGLV